MFSIMDKSTNSPQKNDDPKRAQQRARLSDLAEHHFGQSKTAMAAALDVTATQLSQYLSGYRNIGMAFIDKMRAAGLNPDYILYGTLPIFLDNQAGVRLATMSKNYQKRKIDFNNLAASNKEEFTTNVTLTPCFETREMFEDDGEVSMMPELSISVRAGNPTIFIAEDVRGFRNMRGLFIAKITGDSMTGEGLHDGDEIIIERRSEFKTGDIIVARIGDSYTLKKVVNGNGYILLNPANPDYEPIIISPENHDEFECIGVWTEFIRTRR